MLINGHCSHLKHFTFGRAVTKLAVKFGEDAATELHSDGDRNFAVFGEFDDDSTALLVEDDDDDNVDDVADAADDAADKRCVGDESLVILWPATRVCDCD